MCVVLFALCVCVFPLHTDYSPFPYQVTCSGSPLPDAGLSIGLAVTQTPSDSCPPQTVTGTSTAAVRTPPVVSVQVDSDTITKCSDAEDFTFSATVGTNTGVPVNVEVTPAECVVVGSGSNGEFDAMEEERAYSTLPAQL